MAFGHRFFHTAVFFTVFIHVKGVPDQCTNYKEFDDNDGSRSPHNVYNSSQVKPRFCDATLEKGWYRLKALGDDADMPTTPPLYGSCNSIYPVWLDGQLPAVDDSNVALRGCIVGTVNCSEVLPINVTKCMSGGQSFNVYYLQQTRSTCPVAYCFGTKTKCPSGQSSEDGFRPGCSVQFPDITQVKPVVTPVLGVSDWDPSQQEIRFQCDFGGQNTDPMLFYDVAWYINNVWYADREVLRIKNKASNTLPNEAELREHHWKDDFQMGMNVICAIRARSSFEETPSPERRSDVFFAGLETLNPVIDMKEGEKEVVRFQSTVPVPCLIIGGIVTPCQMFVRFRQIGAHKNGLCNSDDKPSSCGIAIDANNWNMEQTMDVTADYDDTYDDRLSQIYLTCTSPFIGNHESVWDGVEPQPVQVSIHDTTAEVAGSYCSIHNDPHFITFDKRSFDVHLPGEFVLYRHKTLKMEVRGFFQKCGTVAHCVCGAAVRSGSQLFVWSACQDNVLFQTTRVRTYGCNVNQMRVSVNDGGNIYEIQLPTGMKVTISTSSTWGTVRIIPTSADISQTTGLCGNFNGDKEDEYIDPDGIQHNNTCERYLFDTPPNFCMVPTYSKTWMINDTSESYYNGNLVDTFGPPLIGHCYCSTENSSATLVKDITCENVPPVPCGNLDTDVTEEYCTQLGDSLGGRRKRMTSEERVSINDDGVVPDFPIEQPSIYVAPSWTNGWTEDKARAHCRDSMSASPASAPCQNVQHLDSGMLLASCVADILLTGNAEWTSSTIEEYKSRCMMEVKRNTTHWIAAEGEQSVFSLVMNNVCPGDCSSKGKCVKGKCTCSPPWIGPDCTVDSRIPPNVIGLPFGGSCNTENRDCIRTVVYGGDFVPSIELKCRFKELKIDNIHITTTGRSFSTDATFRHRSEVVCSLPSSVMETVSSSYNLSVSNVGERYGSEKMYVTYNGKCVNCVVNGLSVKCLPKNGFCHFGGTCVREGQTKPSGEKCKLDDKGSQTSLRPMILLIALCSLLSILSHNCKVGQLSIVTHK